MAVTRVYVRRGKTVWIGTHTGRTNIDFLHLYTIGPFGAMTVLGPLGPTNHR